MPPDLSEVVVDLLPDLRRVANGIAKRRPDLAEDLVNEAAAALLTPGSLNGYDPTQGSIKPYVIGAAKIVMRRRFATIAAPIAIPHGTRFRAYLARAEMDNGVSLPDAAAAHDLAPETLAAAIDAFAAWPLPDEDDDAGAPPPSPLQGWEDPNLPRSPGDDEVHEALAALDREACLILRLRHGFDGDALSLSELAERLGVSKTTAQRRLRAAESAIADALGGTAGTRTK